MQGYRVIWCEAMSLGVSQEPISTNRNEGGIAQEGTGSCAGRQVSGGPQKRKRPGWDPSLLRYDRLMQDCLGPAHGMHDVMKPDFVGWGYPSKEGDDIPLGQR